MKKLLVAVCMVVMALGVSAGSAEAARLGGGKSVGMQRQAVTPQRAAPTQQAAPAPSTPAGAAAAAPKRNWLGPLAGLAAGLGIAALFSHLGMGAGLANVLTIALLAMAAVFAVKWLLRRKAPAAPAGNVLQYAGAERSGATPPSIEAAPASSAAPTPSAAARIPDDFDSVAFVRSAKLNFVRLQVANDAKNIADIRAFVSPEVYAEIKMQLDERGDAAQQTDIVTLDAELLEVVTEGQRHVASVHFRGMLREAVGAPAVAFSEVWNLTKPVSGGSGWVVAGIQQLS